MINNNLKLERIINNTALKKHEWCEVPLQKKIFYLQSAQNRLAEKSDEWTNLSKQAKHLNDSISGQECLSGPAIIMRQLGFLKKALHENGMPKPKKITQRKNGQYVLQVMPTSMSDTVLWSGFKAEVWVQKNKLPTQGHIYQHKKNVTPGLSLVLGAGNVSSIAPLDAIHKLYQEGRVCIVKLNPVCDYLYQILNEVFFDLIHDGFLAFVTGDSSVGSALCAHDLIDDIHITGSHHTHDLIVWGDPNSQETKIRKKENKPLLTKPITSELGCVTPALIVPGNWGDKDLKFQAKQIASALENNASFNCNAIKVIVTSKNWPQRESFLNYLREELKALPPRYAYYPGAFNRYQEFLKNYPHSEILGAQKTDCIPWTFIPNLSENKIEYALQNEAFCGILAEVSLDCCDTKDFLLKAAPFCHQKIWGTLSCCVFIDPKTEKSYAHEFENLIESLHYGSIAINCWSALSFALGSTTWGAYPGNTLQNVGSGMGMVKNGFMIDYPEKSIITAPFSIWPTPAWFYDKKNTATLSKNLVTYEYKKNFFNLFKLIISSIK